MSSGCIQLVTIQNFKAFRDFQLNLEGRHLLAYGANGSGKSSFYWALNTFLESAGKSSEEVQEYFAPASNKSLVNIHVPSPENETAFIKLELKESESVETYEISSTEHQTRKVPVVVKASLASDFITYRFFFKFADFRSSQIFDIWALFKREILPFCRTTSGLDLNAAWFSIQTNLPHQSGLFGGAIVKAYDELDEKLEVFNDNLSEVIDTIGIKANEFYTEHFKDDLDNHEFAIGLTNRASFDRGSKILIQPTIQFALLVNESEIKRPQVFLNEAKLTQIAISIRFAASLVNLHDSSIKLLVLDDLLVSLDLSNRMKVVEILLSETFDNYQKIILTHDLGFFREFRRLIGVNHKHWCFKRFKGNAVTGIQYRDEKSEIEKAEGYIGHHDLEEAAGCLRKAAEDTAVQYLKLKQGSRVEGEKFDTLSKKLVKAKNIVKNRIPEQMFERVLNDINPALLSKLVGYTDDDINNDTGLDDETKNLLKRKRHLLKRFLSSDGWGDYQDIQILDRLLNMTDRVLNPASHWGEPALYDAEVRKALALINRLEKCLKPKV